MAKKGADGSAQGVEHWRGPDQLKVVGHGGPAACIQSIQEIKHQLIHHGRSSYRAHAYLFISFTCSLYGIVQ
jgi:hypothetical protein